MCRERLKCEMSKSAATREDRNGQANGFGGGNGYGGQAQAGGGAPGGNPSSGGGGGPLYCSYGFLRPSGKWY